MDFIEKLWQFYLEDVCKAGPLKNDLNPGYLREEDPILAAGETISISLPKSESDRMGLTTFSQVETAQFPIKPVF